jgi:hypothetical protein
VCASAWRHCRPVGRCQPFPSYAPDDSSPVDLGYHLTGRCWNTLRDLAESGSFPESHASPPANNNKRTYGSDEPAESPPPDNTPNAPSNGRRPKRISSSRGQPPRVATSALNGATTPSPLSTPPGTRGIRADSSSPGTLTRIFGGDAMPMTTNDLGRLPLHHGVKFPADFGFGQIANGWNTTGSEQSPGLSQVGLSIRSTQAGVIPGLRPPQEQHPEDLFLWMPYTMVMGSKQVPTDSVPAFATVTTATKPVGSVGRDQTRQAADRWDSTISSHFGGVPSSFIALGQTAGLLPGPASNPTEDHADLLGALSHFLILRSDRIRPRRRKILSSPTKGMENGGVGASQLMRKCICMDGRTRRKLLSKRSLPL